jgi:hypothetical protein
LLLSTSDHEIEEDLNAEKDSLMRSYIPYFSYDLQVETDNLPDWILISRGGFNLKDRNSQASK